MDGGKQTVTISVAGAKITYNVLAYTFYFSTSETPSAYYASSSYYFYKSGYFTISKNTYYYCGGDVYLSASGSTSKFYSIIGGWKYYSFYNTSGDSISRPMNHAGSGSASNWYYKE